MLNPFLTRSFAALRSPPDPLACSYHIVMGNEAADPDSCVCAIVLAAALDAALGDDSAVVVPLISVPRADFRLQLDCAEMTQLRDDVKAFARSFRMPGFSTEGL